MDIQFKMSQTNIQGLRICRFFDGNFMVDNYGVLNVSRDDNVDYNTIFHACSISKFITAICVLNLAAKNILNLDKDINKYLHTWKLMTKDNTDNRPTTLRELLSHCSGIIDALGSFNPYVHGETPVSNVDILRGMTRFHTGEVMVSGERKGCMEYSDAGYCVIEQIIQDTTGHGTDFYTQEYIIEPLGLKSTFFWQRGLENTYPLDKCAVGHDQRGKQVDEIQACYPNPSGAGLWSTTTELSIIAYDTMQCFHGKGHILPQSQAMLLLSPHQNSRWNGLGVFLSPEKKQFFSQGWGVGMQSKLVGNIQESKGIVVMMNCDPGVDQAHSIIGEIIEDFM